MAAMRVLSVLEGGQRGEQAHVERLSFAAEVEQDASEIHALNMATLVPNLRIRFLSGRLAHRARMVALELRALTPDDAA